MRPRQQPDQREEIPHHEIHDRPEQAAPPSNDGKSPEPNDPTAIESRGRVCEPYAVRRGRDRRSAWSDSAGEGS